MLLRDKVILLEKHIKEQSKIIQTLELRIEELITMEIPFTVKEREEKKKEFLKQMECFSLPDKKNPKKLENIKKSFWKHREKCLVCLTNEGIPADNNKAGRALRHLVLKRKISFGSKTQKGADRLSILFSVLLSIRNRKPENFFSEYARVRRERVM